MNKYTDPQGRQVIGNEDVKITIEKNVHDSQSSNDHLMIKASEDPRWVKGAENIWDD